MAPNEWESKEHDGRWASLERARHIATWILVVVDESMQQTVSVRLCEQDVANLRQWLDEHGPRR